MVHIPSSENDIPVDYTTGNEGQLGQYTQGDGRTVGSVQGFAESDGEGDGNGWLGAAIVAGLSALVNLWMNKRNNDLQRELSQYSFEQEKQMIQEQNEYNSPVAQMQRYIAAGLNPNLVYGSAGDSKQTSHAQLPVAQTQAGHVDASSIIRDVLAVKDLALRRRKQEAEIKALEHRNRMLDVSAKFNEARWKQFAHYHGLDGDMENSMFTRQWKQEFQQRANELNLFDLRKSAIEYDNALKKLSVKEKEFYNEKMLPLLQEAQALQNAGQVSRNEILRIQAETERLYRLSHSFGQFGPFIAAGDALFDLFGGSDEGGLIEAIKRGMKGTFDTFKRINWRNFPNW